MTRSSLPAAPRPIDPRPAGAPARRPSGAAAIAVALTLRTDFWTPLVQYREDTRWSSLVDPGAAAEVLDPALHTELAGAQVWLLTWPPGQGPDLRDHGTSAGAFAVARGTLTERVVVARSREAVRQDTTDLAAGRVRYFGPHYVHQVTNALPEPAVSVH